MSTIEPLTPEERRICQVMFEVIRAMQKNAPPDPWWVKRGVRMML